MDVTESPYAEFLENFIQNVMELQPEKIGVSAILPDGSVMTGYYGDCCHQDKAIMGYHMTTDAMMDTIFANARQIVEAAQEDEDEEGGMTE